MISYHGPEIGSCEAVPVVPRTLTRRAVQRMNLPRGMLVFDSVGSYSTCLYSANFLQTNKSCRRL